MVAIGWPVMLFDVGGKWILITRNCGEFGNGNFFGVTMSKFLNVRN